MGLVAVKKYWNLLMTALLSSVVACVDAENTLRLRDAAVVYGHPFALVCYTTVQSSTPYAIFYRSQTPNNIGIIVASILYNGPGSCQPSQTSSPNYTYSCDDNGKEITLSVPADNLNEHDTHWRCMNPGGPVVGDNNVVSVFINVPVSLVQLRPTGNVSMRELESRTFTCTTSFCRPKAVISWWNNDVNITNVANPSMYDQNTTGTLVYTGNRLDNGHSIVCKAWNGYGNQQTSQQTILGIRYEPAAPPTIRNYSNGSVFNIIENTSQVLDCMVTGGNPLSYLFWDCFGLASSNKVVDQTVTSTITLTVNRSRNHQQCWCVSTQEVQGNKTTFVEVNVLFPPSVGPFMSPVKVIEGTSLELVCRAEGNPVPKLKWSPQGEDTVNQSRLYYHNITQSNRGNYTCTATNTMEPTFGNPVTQSDFRWLVVEVLYPPVLMAFISPKKVIEGDPFEVECKADGNPPPQLTWNPRGEDKVNQSRLYYHSISRNNHGNHTCTANNTLEPTMGSPVTWSVSKELVIDILFAPTVSPFTLPAKVIEGHSIELVCRAVGNPPPQLKWSPEGEDKINQSRLYYPNISRSNHGNHTCTANNTMEPTNGKTVRGSDSQGLVIDVLFAPVVANFTSPKIVLEGSSLEVNCRADGNPPPKLTWTPQGDVTMNQSMLYYHNISRNNHGTHNCTATSTMKPTTGHPLTQSDSRVIVIDVQYRASIINFSAKDNNNWIMENESLILYCQVDSNPFSDIFLYHDNFQLKKEENVLKLNYTKTVGCLDGGNYTCDASNSVMNGESVSSNILISVACKPRLDHRKNVTTKYYQGFNTNVTLEVFVIAYPEPANITWYHRENETDTWHTVMYQPPSSGGLFSSILIQLISLREFGYYMVSLDNYLGNFSYTYSIIPASPPEIPASLSVVPDSVTTHSLQLSWKAGFHGGASQTFVIEYKEAGKTNWLNKSEPGGLVLYVTLNSTISDLKDGTTYEFRIYSANVYNRSHVSSTINETTKTVITDELEIPNGLPVILGAATGSALVLVIAVAIVCFLFYKRRQTIKSSEDDVDVLQVEKNSSDRHKSGLVDNPVYDSSGPLPDATISGSANGVEYASVVKPNRKGGQVEDPSNLYAQVEKTKNGKKKGQVKEKDGKAHRGDIYENATLAGRDNLKGNMYENSGELKADENIYENPSEKVLKQSLAKKDHLLYADLALDSPTTKNGKYVIRGMENRTEYAEIAYGKRGEPLPDNEKKN